jgi:dTDP-4-dehydrorhamnose 3,5-epimerase
VKISPTGIPDVLVIEPVVHGDDRGFFLEMWHAGRYAEMGVPATFVQDNHSGSVQGTLRGLHYQTGNPQGKLVGVVTGAVFDVAVDLRRSSPTFGRWIGLELSAERRRQLWIPPGFAHGFYVVTPWADVVYKCTAVYEAQHDRSLRWDDPDIGIDWPLLDGRPPLLSPKDAAGASLRSAPLFP